MATIPPNAAAGEHLRRRRTDPGRPTSRQARRAGPARPGRARPCHLAVAAGVLGEWQTVADRENHEEPPEQDGL
jgi:hypothetical protein